MKLQITDVCTYIVHLRVFLCNRKVGRPRPSFLVHCSAWMLLHVTVNCLGQWHYCTDWASPILTETYTKLQLFLFLIDKQMTTHHPLAGADKDLQTLFSHTHKHFVNKFFKKDRVPTIFNELSCQPIVGPDTDYSISPTLDNRRMSQVQTETNIIHSSKFHPKIRVALEGSKWREKDQP